MNTSPHGNAYWRQGKQRIVQSFGGGLRLSLIVPLCVIIVLAAASSCENSTDSALIGDCSIPQNQIFDGGPGKDGIPALTNPKLVSAAEATYLRDDDRVIGVIAAGRVIAAPHNILWWHEIVNFDFEGLALAITYCPLTGSSIGFDRAQAQNAEFGVSGLLYQNNLIMYDRNDDESLWPQMILGARCGSSDGVRLTLYPVAEMTWSGWRTLYPETQVISEATGHLRDYGRYPYGSYEDIDNARVNFPQSDIDTRRAPKERVLGIPDGNGGGLAFPFLELQNEQERRAIHATFNGKSIVVFWERAYQSALAFYTVYDGRDLTFTVENSVITDNETGSVWRFDGRAIDGELLGAQLEPVAEAFVAFWFAWPAFFPDVELWQE